MEKKKNSSIDDGSVTGTPLESNLNLTDKTNMCITSDTTILILGT